MSQIRSGYCDVFMTQPPIVSSRKDEPTEVSQWLDRLYRFCDSPSQVNWEARRQVDPELYQRIVLPAMYKFLDKKIRATTFNQDSMNAVIGLSGGLDSAVASYIVAQAMQDSRTLGRISNANLTLISCTGLEDNETQNIAEDLAQRNDAVNIQYLESDISRIRREMQKTSRKLIGKLNMETTEVPGEITTRSICSLVNEVGTQTGYATIDTTNGTEFILGEFTVGLGYDIVLLSDLYKSSVFALGEILGIPEPVLQTQPRNTAYGARGKPELYFGDIHRELTPRHIFEVLDPIIYWLYETDKSPEEIARALGHDVKFVKKVKTRIDNQKLRRRPPHFCVESHEINLPNSTDLSDNESKKSTEKTMLANLFE